MTPEQVLREYYGFDRFLPLQKAIIDHVAAGGDALVLMPTGGGKSACYQIPSIIRHGVGIVVSPLIALMQDQVDAVRQMGIRAAFLNSTQSSAESFQVQKQVRAGALDLLYVAPERVMTEGFQDLLQQAQLALFAIDEAHCVSQWGHDFRPEYLQLAVFAEKFPAVPRIALTATADTVTRKEIVEKLKLNDARQFVASFDRPNIAYQVLTKDDEKAQLLHFIRKQHQEHSGIVYCMTRKKTEKIARWPETIGHRVLVYHAGLDPQTRMHNQRRFLTEDGLVMVATIAFGMGIDKPNIRFVAHLDLPKSLESYYQETGRAGRDGLPADAWMAYGLADVVLLRQLLAGSDGSEEFKRVQQIRIEAMLGYCETTVCRRQVLLQYFGEPYAGPCGNCDICNGGLETFDGTVAAQKALSCVYRTGQRFGANYLIDVLHGKSTERILRFGHDKVSTFGIGQEHSAAEWKSIFRQLVASGMLIADIDQKGGFRLAPACRPLLRGEQKFTVRKDRIKTTRPSAPKAPSTPAKAPLTSGEAEQLWEKLRALRLELAKEQGVPSYIIFHDRSLREMAERMPRSMPEMQDVFGVGEKKLELYGKKFLQLILQHAGESERSE